MKTVSHACITLLAGFLPLVLGQGSLSTASLAPSPTQSVGCEAHGDHWHCDRPRVTSITASASTFLTSRVTAPPPAVTSSPAHSDDDHDHDDDHHHSDGSLKPSPTASVGCVPHGDHWHCDRPATATPTESAVETEQASSSVSAVPTSAATQHGMGLLSLLGSAMLGAVFAF